MRSEKKKKFSKKTKWITSIAAGILVVSVGGLLWVKDHKGAEKASYYYTSTTVGEGSISSSTLLSGNVKAVSEQYVYFDSSKGSSATPTVSVGDEVVKGQQLVQYDKTTTQAAYDTAVRNLNKVGRQINNLTTYGISPTTQTSTDEETGETQTTTVAPSAQSVTSYNQQLQDLNDNYADTQAEVNKAQEALNQTIILSDIDGKVVEVNQSIDPSSKSSQTIVHVATEGQLQIQGTLSEYDLANIHPDEEVKIKSKVYPDKEWTGKISYVSNYPKENASGTDNSSSGGASYEYKADITSDVDVLKQGFSVSVEVINANKFKLVPVNAVVTSGKKHYVWLYDSKTKKVKRAEVSLGKADATQQEITNGVELNQEIIANPNNDLKDNQKIEDVTPANVTSKE